MHGAGGRAKLGLGTGIVEALSRQLGAKVTVSDTLPGTKVAIIGGRRPTLGMRV